MQSKTHTEINHRAVDTKKLTALSLPPVRLHAQA